MSAGYAADVTFLAAAIVVLRRSKRPMTSREITERALELHLIPSTGKTPEATMSAALYGAPKEGPVQREWTAGAHRAIRGSVRWRYIGTK